MPAKAGTAELAACLTLVAPTGMTEEERAQWLAVARQTLSGIPEDLLKRACAKARQTCRFPSEIVPAIMADAEPWWSERRRRLYREKDKLAAASQPALEKQDPPATREEVAAIMAEFGLKRAPGAEPRA